MSLRIAGIDYVASVAPTTGSVANLSLGGGASDAIDSAVAAVCSSSILLFKNRCNDYNAPQLVRAGVHTVVSDSITHTPKPDRPLISLTGFRWQ